MNVESTPRADAADDPTAPPAPSPPPEPAAPPRPIWNQMEPAAPWCPDDWRVHLDAIAPGLFASATAAAHHEATGASLRATPWSLVLSSRRGRLHAHRGEHREDAGHLLHFSNGWCAAVADGAGSASYSRIGSALATFTATHALREALQHGAADEDALAPALRTAAQATNDAQRAFAAQAGLALRDLRTTLLVAVVHRGRLGVMQVGDGAMALVHADGAVTHPHAAATGDYSGEVAHFLPDDGALEVLQASVSTHAAGSLAAVLLATDGVEDPWYPFTRWAGPLVQTLAQGTPSATQTPGESPLPPSLVPSHAASVLGAADPVHALAEWLAFEKRGENDDRTLCVAYTPALVVTGVSA